MKKKKEDFQLLKVDLEDIIEEYPNIIRYCEKLKKWEKLSENDLIDLQIALGHMSFHFKEGKRAIEKILKHM